jgi:hypothetical protein
MHKGQPFFNILQALFQIRKQAIPKQDGLIKFLYLKQSTFADLITKLFCHNFIIMHALN